MAAVADVDLQAAIERRLDHRMHLTLAIDEAARMTRERMGKDIALAEKRSEARASRDFDAADRLRSEIEEQGWEVRDVADGFELVPK